MTDTPEPRRMRGVVLKDGTHCRTYSAQTMYGVEPEPVMIYAESISETTNGVHVTEVKERLWQTTMHLDTQGKKENKIHRYRQETVVFYPWHMIDRYYTITETDQ